MMRMLNLERAALLSIDFQLDFLQDVLEAEATITNASRVLTAARQAKLPIIHTQEVHRKNLVDFGRELEGTESIHCLENASGTAIHPVLTPLDGEAVIVKRRYSAFFGTDLEILLRGLQVDTVILMGTLTHVCVHYTAVDAHQRDYYLYVIADCCAGSDRSAHLAALNAMEYLQTGACISHTDVLEAMVRGLPRV